MTRIQKIAAGAIALLAVGVAGGAVAATKIGPEEQSRAVVNDAAEQLGVTPERLSNALKTAMRNQIDAAVKAGRLTQEEGNRLKARIDEQDVPMLGPGFHRGPHGHGFRHGGPGHSLEAAAKYLGMTEAAVREALEGGKTLAQLAGEKDKTVSGLVTALVAEKRARIQQEVKAGRLTQAQANRFLDGVRERVTDMVNGRHPRPGFGRPGMPRGPPASFTPTY